jgi:hypothetical protein
VNFDTDKYQALRVTLVNALINADYEEGAYGRTSGFIVLPLNRGTEASLRVVFSNTYLPMGTQLDTSNQWLEWYLAALEDVKLPVVFQLFYGTVQHIAGEDVYTMPYLHVTPVLSKTVQNKKYSLV